MFQEVDPILGPEMRSTGEVLGLARDPGAAFFKAEEAASSKLPTEGAVLISVNNSDKPEVAEIAKSFYDDGFKIYATGKTYELISEAGIPAEHALKDYEGRPNVSDLIINGKVDLVINTPAGKQSVHSDSYVRKNAIKAKVPYITTIAAARAAAEGIHYVKAHDNGEVKSLQSWHGEIEE